LLFFSEALRDQLADGGDGVLCVGPCRVHCHSRALRAAQEQDAHHALGVRSLAVFLELDFGCEARRELHELGRRARVEAQLVHDLEAIAALHALSSLRISMTDDSIATLLAKPVPERLADRHRSMLTAGATDCDRQVRLALCLVTRERMRKQAM